MTEEEKEAIGIAKTFDYRSKTINYNKLSAEDVEAINIILNLIDKLQKEIEELKKELEIFNGIKKGTTIMFGAKTQYWRKDKIEKYYISKDKIRNEIKELENILEKRKTIDIIEEINRLEELLKENDIE